MDLHMEASTILTGKLAPNFFRERWHENYVQSNCDENQKVLPHIIHHNQSGYVEGRYIWETVRSIFDIMDFSVKENISGLLIFWIFRKLSTALNGIFLSAA